MGEMFYWIKITLSDIEWLYSQAVKMFWIPSGTCLKKPIVQDRNSTVIDQQIVSYFHSVDQNPMIMRLQIFDQRIDSMGIVSNHYSINWHARDAYSLTISSAVDNLSVFS